MAISSKPYTRQQAWMFVGAEFQSGHPACVNCEYHYSQTEREPYGEGYACRSIDYCGLTDSVGGSPECCPAYIEFKAEQAEMAAEASHV